MYRAPGHTEGAGTEIAVMVKNASANWYSLMTISNKTIFACQAVPKPGCLVKFRFFSAKIFAELIKSINHFQYSRYCAECFK